VLDREENDVSAGVAAHGAAAQARDVANSRPAGWAARAGLTARGLVYVLVGVLAVTVARGAHHEVDQKGAFQQLLTQPYGKVLVGAMAVGLAGYALWRLSEAAFGVTGESGKGPRLQSLVRGVVYAALAASAVSVLYGSHSSQAGQQSELTARVMHHAGGRWLVGGVGVIVAVVGLVLAWQGLRLRFMKYFPAGSLPPGVRGVVRLLGWLGNVARGLVFALVGVLIVVAAVRFEPSKAGGLDEALKTLRDRSYGPLILGVIAGGLIAFGAYGLLEARYRRV
jgi:Domain of Unknown Function (DUF1206)